MIEPTFEEELTRKAGEALSWLDNEYKRGGVNSAAFQAALIALDMATNGLIPNDYSLWAAQARTDARSEAYPDKVVMTNDNGITIVAELVRALGQIIVVQIGSKGTVTKKTMAFENEVDSVVAAKEKFPKLIAAFSGLGYEELK